MATQAWQTYLPLPAQTAASHHHNSRPASLAPHSHQAPSPRHQHKMACHLMNLRASQQQHPEPPRRKAQQPSSRRPPTASQAPAREAAGAPAAAASPRRPRPSSDLGGMAAQARQQPRRRPRRPRLARDPAMSRVAQAATAMARSLTTDRTVCVAGLMTTGG